MSTEITKTVANKPQWHERWGISEDAADHLWEIAASYILEIEDSGGGAKASKEHVWRMMHDKYPDWYPSVMPHTLRDHWWQNEQFREYVALRRQEHLLRTMPARLQIQRYYGHLQSIFGEMVIERAMNDPESFSNAQLLAFLKEVNSGLLALEEDKRKAAGEETGQNIKIDVFQFLDKVPRDRQNVIIGKLVREKVRPALESGNGNGD